MNELSKVEHIVRGHPGVAAALAAGAGLLAYRHYRAGQAAASFDSQAIAPIGVAAPGATGSDSLFAADTSPASTGAPADTGAGASGGTYSNLVPVGYPVGPQYSAITPPSGYTSEADAAYAAVGGGVRGATASATISSANTLGDACSPKLGQRGCNPGKCKGFFGCIGHALTSLVTCPVAVITFGVNCGARVTQTGLLAAATAGEVVGSQVSKIPGVAGTPYGAAAGILGNVGQIGQQPQQGYGIPYQQQSPYGYQQPSPYIGYGTPYGFTPPIAPYSVPYGYQQAAPAVPVPTGKVPSPAVQQYGLTLV